MSKVEIQSPKSVHVMSAAVENQKDPRYSRARGRKFSCVNHIAHLVGMLANSGRPRLQRSASLPDCKELMETKAATQITKKHQNANDPKKLKRTTSVSFQPEVVFFSAVIDNDIDTLRNLVSIKKVNVNYKSPTGITALHYAAAEGNSESIKVLLEFGAKVNILNSYNDTPLDFAVRGGHFECAALLIQSGAEINRIVHGVSI